MEIADFHWRGLYKISGITTVVMMICFLFDTICWVALRPYPSSAEGWFSLLQENREEARIAATVTGANTGGLLAEGALMIFSFLMLGSNVFNRGTADMGIFGHGLDLIRTTTNLAFLPEGIGAILLAIGGLPQLIWLILISRKFFQMSNAISRT